MVRQFLKYIKIGEKCVKRIVYRLFDYRFIYYTKTKGVVTRSSYKIMKHMLNIDNNIDLLTTRFFVTKSFKHNFVVPSSVVIEQCLFPNGINGGESYYLFPLFIIEEQRSLLDSSVKTNFQENFINFINDRYHKQFEVQEILG
ncbi:hypothetical protein bmLB2001_001213 (plasmid) [Borrelia miyamotoi]|nr:hypothetical protein bmLB2001_001213 [Borrelia miyamotoi]